MVLQRHSATIKRNNLGKINEPLTLKIIFLILRIVVDVVAIIVVVGIRY